MGVERAERVKLDLTYQELYKLEDLLNIFGAIARAKSCYAELGLEVIRMVDVKVCRYELENGICRCCKRKGLDMSAEFSGLCVECGQRLEELRSGSV